MIGRAEIERHLGDLLQSPQFLHAPKHSAFLKFVTLAALDGRNDAIKEAVIASEVYGRDNYDPSIDSLIRVEASRLRKKLDDFYAASTSPVRIRLPKGTYVPVFESAQPPSRTLPWWVAAAAAVVLAGIAAVAAWQFHRSQRVRALLNEANAARPAGKDFTEMKQSERGAHDLAGVMRRVALYERVLELDPRNAAALEGLANTYYRAIAYEPDLIAKMNGAAQRLRAVHPDSGPAAFYLGYHAHFVDRDFARSAHLFRYALERSPNDEGLYRYVTLPAIVLGDTARVLPLLEQGRKRFPDSAIVSLAHLAVLINLNRFADAESEAAALIARRPDLPAAYSRRGWSLYYLGRKDEAQAQFEKCLAISPGEPSCTTNLAYLFYETRRPHLAKPFEEQVQQFPESSRHLYLAMIQMARQRRDSVLEELELAARAGDMGLPYARRSNMFAPLHGDPRFERIFQ